jgi:Fur family ferric uptake transcriptional regulator
MTAAHLNATILAAPDADAAAAALRATGRRLSSARRLVLEALYAADGPVTADEIADGVGGRVPRSDLASVYRNLETLEQLGLVRHVHLGHGPGRYAPSGPWREYAVCERCDAVLAVPAGQLDPVRAAIDAATGFHARFHHFPISGLCPGCRDSDDVRA